MPALVSGLEKLAKTYAEVHVYLDPGNHGKIGRFNDPRSKFDILLGHMLRFATQNIKNIKWNISDDWKQSIEISGCKFLLIHGHQIRMYLRTPYYGIENKGLGWNAIMEDPFDYLIMGHFHHSTAGNDMPGFEVLMNGTWLSDDEWALEQLARSSSTKQLFFGIHPRRGVSWRYKLDVTH